MNRRERRRQQKAEQARSVGSPVQALQQQATAFYQAGRLKDALRVCWKILAAEPERADVSGFAGMIAIELGDNREAVKRYERAVELRPDYAEAHYNLGNALKNLERFDDALAAYRRAAEIRPDLAPAYHNQGSILQTLERYQEAAEAYARVLELMPEAAETQRNLGMVLQKLDRLDEATDAFRRAIQLKPEWFLLYNNLATALLEQGNPGAAVAACDEWLTRSPGNMEALAFKCVALNEAGNQEDLATLLDFDRFVHKTRIDVPLAYNSLGAFNAALAEHVCNHPTLKVPPEDDPTYHHPQLQITDELLVEPKGPIADLEQLILAAVDEYKTVLAANPDHPFVASWPERWRLTMWSVVLNGQGNLVPHIHMDGYLGGVYYAELPDVVDAGEDAGHAGWFELGRSPLEQYSLAAPRVHAIKPELGLMLLFPSYFYHGTVPFESTQRRISIAFDLVPEK